MARLNAFKENWIAMEIKGIPGYFNDMRIDRESVPAGYTLWELADADSNGEPCRYRPGILVNFYGTFITKGNLPIEYLEMQETFISDDEWGFTGDRYMPLAELIKQDFIEEQNEGPEVFESRIVMEFKAKTLEMFNTVGTHDAEEIEEIVSDYIKAILAECNIHGELHDLAIIGSRARGIETSTSDLDLVAEIDTDEKEDVLFDILNSPGMSIEGIKVDINPITKYKTGTLEQYLTKAEKYLQQKITKRNEASLDLYNAVKAGNLQDAKRAILNGADVNYTYRPEEYKYTPIHMAAYYADKKMLNLLIENKCDINPLSLDLETPLSMAQQRHGRENICELLLQHGAKDYYVPIPDCAPVGEIFMTEKKTYLLVDKNGKIKEYQRSQLERALLESEYITDKEKEVQLDFENNAYEKIKVNILFTACDKNKVPQKYLEANQTLWVQLAGSQAEYAVAIYETQVMPRDENDAVLIGYDTSDGTRYCFAKSGIKQYHLEYDTVLKDSGITVYEILESRQSGNCYDGNIDYDKMKEVGFRYIDMHSQDYTYGIYSDGKHVIVAISTATTKGATIDIYPIENASDEVKNAIDMVFEQEKEQLVRPRRHGR